MLPCPRSVSTGGMPPPSSVAQLSLKKCVNVNASVFVLLSDRLEPRFSKLFRPSASVCVVTGVERPVVATKRQPSPTMLRSSPVSCSISDGACAASRSGSRDGFPQSNAAHGARVA